MVAAIYDWLRAQGSDPTYARWNAEREEMQGKAEAEQSAIWNRYRQEDMAESERIRRDIYEKVGGRATHVLNEYRRRGKIDDAQYQRFLWKMNSVH